MNHGRVIAAVAAACLSGAAWAVQPATWVHTAEADFEPGQTEGTVVTNLGDIKLATATRSVVELGEQTSIVYDTLAADDGSVFIAAGPEAKLLRWTGEQTIEVARATDGQIFALGRLGNHVLVAVSAEGGSRLAMIGGEGLATLVELPDVRYVWDIAVSGEAVWLATGTEGQVLQLTGARAKADALRDGGEAADVAVTVALDAAPANVLCLARGEAGVIYAGTDTDGLVYRIAPRAGDAEGFETFVMYDAPEPEIGAILATANGLYVGTADASQAKPGRLEEAAGAEGGRPSSAEGAPVEAGPEDEPAPPDPDDLPQVPPKAPPIGEPDGDAEQGGDARTGEGEPATADDLAVPAAARPQAVIGPREPTALARDEAADASAKADAGPTPQQYDRLREVIRQRLEQARRTGALQVGRPMAVARRGPAPARAAGRPQSAGSPPREGNAVYRIDANGFVAEVFRESVMILKLIEVDGQLLVATGNEGQIYRVDPLADETTILADLEPQQVPSILRGRDGAVLLGTANPASLVRLADGFAESGHYTSPVMDATQISLWGRLKVSGEVPPAGSLTVQTRSGNVENVEDAAWSAWVDAGVIEHDPDALPLEPIELTIASPPARFLQYRLVLAGDGRQSPVVDRVQLAYATPNLKPTIASIAAQYPDAAPGQGSNPQQGQSGPQSGPTGVMNITWEAADANNDRLVYSLEYQAAGSELWLPLAENLQTNSYEWNTRQAPDGRYRIRVVASDRLDNPLDMALVAQRVSDPVVVDNTPPQLVEVVARRDGRTLTLEGRVLDSLSPIGSIQYTLNAEDEARPILPEDLILDSTRETFRVTITDLAPGPHVVTLRATDARGNATYQAVVVKAEVGARPAAAAAEE